MKALYDKAFTEYEGHVGYAPAIVTITVVCALCSALAYGGFVAGKAAFAQPIAKKAALSSQMPG